VVPIDPSFPHLLLSSAPLTLVALLFQ
jgi:hypothetical protein